MTTASLTAQLNVQLAKDGVQLRAPVSVQYAEILSPDALRFLAMLHRQFNGRRLELLLRREYRQKAIDAGQLPDFLPETASVRTGDWKGPPPAPGMVDRRVEITGPVDRKMVINALNSGASTFMADFEDSNAPTWDNNVSGQVNLRDANRRTISLTQGNKEYKLNATVATLIVRPRGWHLEEKHLFIDGVPISASLFDFGLYFFHNAHQTLKIGAGPYFYLPKMESHLEARLWNDVFNRAQYELGLPRGSIRATCLIETLMAAFEMDEFLYELRDHTAGLNCLSDDSQVLTDHGFKGFDELRAYFAKTPAERAAAPLLFATYDAATKQMVYQRALACIVKPAGPKDMVEITHSSYQAAWSSAADQYGRTSRIDAAAGDAAIHRADGDRGDEGGDEGGITGKRRLPSNGVSMLVTPDHDLFGLIGRQVEGHRRITWAKQTVKGTDGRANKMAKNNPQMVNKDPSKFAASSIVSSDDKMCIKFFGAAKNGILRTTENPLPFVAALGLTSQTQIDAFLQLYGFWLGDGSLYFPATSMRSAPAVTFAAVKIADKDYLRETFAALGLVEGRDLRVYECHDGLRYHGITKPAWVEYFKAEYGKKYVHSGMREVPEGVGATRSQDKDEDAPLKRIKSSKWFFPWVLESLNKDEALLVIRGIRRADGREATDVNCISTSSVAFRDQLVQLCMHAGYAVAFRLERAAGTISGTNRDGTAIVASVDGWCVAYHESDKFSQPVVKSVRDVAVTRSYSGVAWCVTVPNGTIFVRRATVVDGVVTKASMATVMGNCGRWDYIFSTIKRLRNYPEFVLPDRADVTMTVPFMANYVKLLIKTCHRRGVHAMGGMSAQIPVKDDPKANELALEKVRNDKMREVQAGHDGTWVAHPGLVDIALKIFTDNMTGPNQLDKLRLDVSVTAKDLLPHSVPGKITEAGVRGNISVGLQYMESWLRGVGCVPIHNLMEDAATAEIARSQLWQWLRHGSATADGTKITRAYLDRLLEDEVGKIHKALGPQKYAQSKFDLAKVRFAQTLQQHYEDFLTLICYDDIVSPTNTGLRSAL